MIPQHFQEAITSLPPQFVCIDGTPTQSHAENKQINPFWLHAQRVQAANNELQQNLRDKGIEPRRHTINDFEHVILTQLNLQLEGQNPTPTEVLRAAFPADSGKAESIGKSTYHQLWRRAYASPRIISHTVVQHMLKVVSQRDMNLRSGARTFSNSLAAGALLFKLAVETHAAKEWKDNLDQTKQRYHALDQLAADPPTSKRAAVLALKEEGRGRTEIAQLLGMKLDTVNYYLRPRTERKAAV